MIHLSNFIWIFVLLENTKDSKTETGEKCKKSDDNEMDAQEEDDDDLEERFHLLEKGNFFLN